MGDEVTVQCPWCAEALEVWVERDSQGTMVRDCDVCCRPWTMHVAWSEDGEAQVFVDRS